MANDKVSNEQNIGQQIADGIREGLAQAAGPKKVPFGEYARRAKAKANLPAVRFASVMQNGRDAQLTKREEIEPLNRITHSGRYLDRRVEVIVSKDTEGQEHIQFRYNDATIDQRMDNKSLWRSFADMARQIAEAQEVERLEKATSPAGVVRASA